jgi:hypothetical protein
MKKIIAILLAFSAAILMSGCTASYQSEFLHPQATMQTQTRFLIVTPEIGRYGDIEYSTSGVEVVTALTKELKNYSQSITTILSPVTIENIRDEDLQNSDYVFIPQILHWEDRLTGWSFRPDRIQVRFDIYNNQRELVNSYLITGRSAYVVWVSRQPNSLLKKPIRDMLKTFFSQQ